jgi:hypothetical protein
MTPPVMIRSPAAFAHQPAQQSRYTKEDEGLVGEIDDLELTGPADGPPLVAAVLAGLAARRAARWRLGRRP